MSVIEQKKAEEFHRKEIRKILIRVKRSLKKEKLDNHGLLELYNEIEKDFKDIENKKVLTTNIADVYEKATQLLIQTGEVEKYYKKEIKKILAKANKSFKKECIYDYELLELYSKVEKDFKNIEGNSILANNIVDIYEDAKQLSI
ncbi:hypothetical protein COC97_24440 [Bacillus anthracis]|nr:hypothetical protein COC97_24440 [Bacillus anthracis]